jgi:hypothetical protein
MSETVVGMLFDPGAMNIRQFCADHNISEAYYYVLRARGEGPDESVVPFASLAKPAPAGVANANLKWRRPPARAAFAIFGALYRRLRSRR